MHLGESLRVFRRRLKKVSRITLSLIVSMSILSAQAHSTQLPKSPLQEALEACDQALTACDKALEDKNKVIQAQSELILKQTKQIGEIQAQNATIWNSPVFWAVVGLVAGVGLTIGSASLVKEINR